jgi:hypothetical protein
MGVKLDSVTLHIEELVLTGFPSGSRDAIADAVRVDLKRLISERGIGNAPTRGGSYEELHGGAFTLPARAGASTSGSGIAERLYTTLSQEGGTNGKR